jgi:hypothetical protein
MLLVGALYFTARNGSYALYYTERNVNRYAIYVLDRKQRIRKSVQKMLWLYYTERNVKSVD